CERLACQPLSRKGDELRGCIYSAPRCLYLASIEAPGGGGGGAGTRGASPLEFNSLSWRQKGRGVNKGAHAVMSIFALGPIRRVFRVVAAVRQSPQLQRRS